MVGFIFYLFCKVNNQEFLSTNIEKKEDFVFEKYVIKLYKAISMMEDEKFLEQKFSNAFKDLSQYIYE